MKCANCGSRNTQAITDTFQCLDCGRHTEFDGGAVRAEHDKFLVGNIADLQRAGGAIAHGGGGGLAGGVELPADTSEEQAKDSAGEAARRDPTKGDEVTTSASVSRKSSKADK